MRVRAPPATYTYIKTKENTMAIELHHLNTHGMMEQACDVLDGVVRLKARIAELEEERRWRKFSEEKPPKYTWCLVSGKSQMGNYIVITDFFEEDDWAENPNLNDDTLYIEWWMPMPSAPKEKK